MARELVRDCAIGVMAKTPRPGASKTRLCPPLRPEQAAAMSAAFLADTTANILEAARSSPITGYAAYAPAGSEHLLVPHLAEGIGYILADGTGEAPEAVEGFGRCLLDAIETMFARGHAAACVLSSDTPTLPTRCLSDAADLLLAGPPDRVVLGACADGGYYLLGMSAVHAGLFADIAWSTDSVADATRARARMLGLELIELEAWYDVDDAASLTTLLGERNGFAAPRTRSEIERLGLAALLSSRAA